MAKSEKIEVARAEDSSDQPKADQNVSTGRFVYKLVRMDIEDVRPSSFRSLWWRSIRRNQFFFAFLGPIVGFWAFYFQSQPM